MCLWAPVAVGPTPKRSELPWELEGDYASVGDMVGHWTARPWRLLTGSRGLIVASDAR